MKIFPLPNLFVLFVLLSASVTVASEDLYEVNGQNQGFKVSWSGGSLVIDDVLGDKGQITRDLIDFNGGKALHYENPTTKSHFEAYLTISRVDAGVVIDCIYGDMRNNMNGLLINKAVCGLNKKLEPGYEDLIYKYSNTWKGTADLTVLTRWIEAPTSPIKIEEASFKDLTIARIYTTLDDLIWSLPTTVVEGGGHEYSFGGDIVFTVFNARDLKFPGYIEVVNGSLAAPFGRLAYEGLKAFISRAARQGVESIPKSRGF